MSSKSRLTIFFLIYKITSIATLNISFDASITILMDETVTKEYSVSQYIQSEDITSELDDFVIYSENENIAKVRNGYLKIPNGTFTVTGIFLGKTYISCKNLKTGEKLLANMEVIVSRKERLIDILFTASAATLVSLTYINFGCALKWGELKNILKKPIGPAIGFCGQFIFMPLLSYVLGLLLFPDSPSMRLGLFFTGSSPGGGASNLWTLLLGGNIDLSIVMSAVSTIAAFAMMPLWIFTLGKTIFDSGNLTVPYTQIVAYVAALLVPLGVGYLMQRYLQKISRFLVKIMKTFSTVLLVFLVIFAIVANLWLFELFTYKIIIAGMVVPWLGFVAGFVISKLLRQPLPDCTAIAIEIGIQNTGISIFLLRFTLSQPEADLTTIMPVSIAILTPFPLLILLLYKKIRERFASSQLDDKKSGSCSTVSTLKL